MVVREVDADLAEYELDLDATKAARARIREARLGWLREEPASVAERFRSGDLDAFDLVRHYGVIVDWGTGELMPKSTEAFRSSLLKRAVAHWKEPVGEDAEGQAAE